MLSMLASGATAGRCGGGPMAVIEVRIYTIQEGK